MFATFHEYFEVLEGGPGILHHDVPEGDGVAALARPHPGQVEERAPAPVVPVRTRVHHRDVLHHKRVTVEALLAHGVQLERGSVGVLPVHHC